MKTCIDCIPCFVRQAIDFTKLITDDQELTRSIISDILAWADKIDYDITPPVIAREIYVIVRERTLDIDPYKKHKIQFNQFALDHLDMFQEMIDQSSDPLETAIIISTAGNIIDMGVGHHISDEKIRETVHRSLEHPLDPHLLSKFRKDIESAESILFLGDNSGEIAIDKLLIKQLPMEKITFAVRGKPIINDATMEDALQVGMTDLVKVIDNGDDTPGTAIERCSEDFRKHFEQADVIISKGQGNFETLNESDKNIYFILKAKCPVVVRELNKEAGESVFINTKHC